MDPSKVFSRTGGRDGLWSDTCSETCIHVAADFDSEAHSGPCYRVLGPTSQPLSAPPQRLGGCADTLTSIFSKPPYALVPVEVLDPGVMKFAGLFNQQHVDPRYLLWLLAKAVDSDAIVPMEYIGGQVILLLHFCDLRDGRGGIDPLKVETIFGGVSSWSLWIMWWICQSRSKRSSKICQSRSKRPSKTVVIPVFHVDYCLLRPYSCWEWDVRAASRG